jgi:hypothetical protein
MSRSATHDEAFSAALAEASQTLERIGEDPALSAAALERYARACADAALLRYRWEGRGSPTSALGSTGQAIVHPLVEGIRKAEREAADLGDRLGLTPAARKSLARRVGHPVGAAQAPDRAAPIRRVK